MAIAENIQSINSITNLVWFHKAFKDYNCQLCHNVHVIMGNKFTFTETQVMQNFFIVIS